MRARYRQESEEVFYIWDGKLAFERDDIDFLLKHAAQTKRRRARICLHPDPGAQQHEMLIVHHRDCYVRPHKHLGRGETFQVIDGCATMVFFDDAGVISTCFGLNPPNGSGAFFCRVPDSVFHTILIDSEWLVFAETTLGPFSPKTTAFPDWAPPEADRIAVDRYRRALEKRVADRSLSPSLP